jgi:hypothetical protein
VSSGMKIKYSTKVQQQLGMDKSVLAVLCFLCHRPLGGRGSTPSVTLNNNHRVHSGCLRIYLQKNNTLPGD